MEEKILEKVQGSKVSGEVNIMYMWCQLVVRLSSVYS